MVASVGEGDNNSILTVTDVNRTALALLLHQFRQQQQQQVEEENARIKDGCPPGGGGDGAGGTTFSSFLPRAAHRSSAADSCEDTTLHALLLGPGFLALLTMALLGNCLTLLIYQTDRLVRTHSAIRMLCTKLAMNTLMMCCLLPQALRMVGAWPEGSRTDLLYWRYWPYQVYFANVFGFCAMWLTVLMTAECYLHVFAPTRSTQLCSKQNVGRSYCAIGAAALLLALIYPLNRTVNLSLAILIPLALLVFMTGGIVWKLRIKPAYFVRHSFDSVCPSPRQVIHDGVAATPTASPLRRSPVSRNGNHKGGLEPNAVGGGGWQGSHISLLAGKCSTASNHLRKMIAPLRSTKQHFHREKSGVTRITLITTLLQLITEAPSVPVLIYAAVWGPHRLAADGGSMCTWQTLSHFLGLGNASLSFFVYIAFSWRFRSTMLNNARTLGSNCFPSFIARPGDGETLPRKGTAATPPTTNRSFQCGRTQRKHNHANGKATTVVVNGQLRALHLGEQGHRLSVSASLPDMEVVAASRRHGSQGSAASSTATAVLKGDYSVASTTIREGVEDNDDGEMLVVSSAKSSSATGEEPLLFGNDVGIAAGVEDKKRSMGAKLRPPSESFGGLSGISRPQLAVVKYSAAEQQQQQQQRSRWQMRSGGVAENVGGGGGSQREVSPSATISTAGSIEGVCTDAFL